MDLALHAGDITENGSPVEMEQAGQFFKAWGIPIVYCLGNHDLAAERALERWVEFPFSGVRDLSIGGLLYETGGWDIIVLNNTWKTRNGKAEWKWNAEEGGSPGIFDFQLAWLEDTLARTPERPCILLIHVPMHVCPDNNPYAVALNRVLDRHPRVKAVLGGHTHAVQAEHRRGRVHFGISALVEPPFECCLVRCSQNTFSLEAVPSIPMPSGVEYLEGKRWVQGSPEDRSIYLQW